MSTIAASSSDTTRSLSEISDVSGHLSDLAASVQQTATELGTLSGELRQVVGRFKT